MKGRMLTTVEEWITPGSWNLLQRWCAFNLVGLLGIVVQLLALTILHQGFGLHYLPATALAVEAAVLHNYRWHVRWTWADRPRSGAGNRVRLIRFNLSTGLVSIGGNLLLMDLFVGKLGWPWVAANLAAIAVCSIGNFLVSHGLIFQRADSAR